jgi:hypothetical protein
MVNLQNNVSHCGIISQRETGALEDARAMPQEWWA